MNFTPLYSFSKRLSAVMLPLFEEPSTQSRELLDNCWLIWQLQWLCKDTPLIPERLLDKIVALTSQVCSEPTVSNEVRRLWIQSVGFPQQKSRRPLSASSPAEHLEKILATVLPQALSPEEKLSTYLQDVAGLPAEKMELIKNWLANESQLPAEPHREKQENFPWLNAEEIAETLMSTQQGRQLKDSGLLSLLALPAEMPRPASFLLPDRSMWLLWPEASQTTTIDPVLQKALVCHEAAHLCRNLDSAQGSAAPLSESIWESEKHALFYEWLALLNFFQSEQLENRSLLWQQWTYDNDTLQKVRFFKDWHAFVNQRSKVKQLRPSLPDSSWISLPFLNAVYACLSEELLFTHKSTPL